MAPEEVNMGDRSLLKLGKWVWIVSTATLLYNPDILAFRTVRFYLSDY